MFARGPKHGNVSIVSNNQSGGITAHTVNVGPQKLQVTEDVKLALLKLVPQDKPIRVKGVGSDIDLSVALEIAEFLIANGYPVLEGVSHTKQMVPAPEHKIEIRDLGSFIQLTITPRA